MQRAPVGGRHQATLGAWIWPGALGVLPGAGGSHWAARRWSTGVIMYTLLAGSPPFWHRKQMLMLRMIMNGDYQFGSPEWDDRSDTVKDLVGAWGWENLWEAGFTDTWDTLGQSNALVQISRFLVVDPQQRYTAGEALAHPFFQQYDVEEVRHFSPFRKFKVRLGMEVSQHPDPEPRSCRR